MKKTLAAITFSALAAGTALVPAHAATAAPTAERNAPCITKQEFRKVKKGITLGQVAKVVGGKGKQEYFDAGYPGEYGWPASQFRSHKQCGGKYTGLAMIDYERQSGVWKVTGRTAFWL